MRILAVDTATRSCSVAVIDGQTLLAEAIVTTGETHSRHLMNLIDQVLQISRVSLKDIDGFAVTRGPGSFTGLRIGISTIKGFAASSGKPMVGVSTLDALANQADVTPYLICTVIDARKEEVYFGRYRRVGGVLIKETEEEVLSIVNAIQSIHEPSYFIGDGSLIYKPTILEMLGEDRVVFAPRFHHTIRGVTVANLGVQRIEKNNVDDVSTFRPRYIRKSDAELNLAKRHFL
ncbi:MAG TPA: tRNA (adenosine(37)-N6)-threonylcarbamoyltransferase complex dimerization subunit type 1 TsaB [Deltaproteobacteria bacterium]|nr:tRNA (adenosine(37)-N6)-threonylcarbamoyltransferase complex dimerization subunit type 1 TsaB [Deltaproteobacteria bacterium]